MIEDLIMEFDEVPENTAETLAELRAAQGEIAAALGAIMVGLVDADPSDGAASLTPCTWPQTHSIFSNPRLWHSFKFWNM